MGGAYTWPHYNLRLLWAFASILHLTRSFQIHLEHKLPRMASKITRLRWPPYRVQSGGAQCTHYLKIVFEYNNQRKDLMDKPIIDGQWERMVNEQIREKHIRRALIETV